jgi:hypothetical protein
VSDVRIDVSNPQVLKQLWITALAEPVEEFARPGDVLFTRDRREPTQLTHPPVIAFKHFAMKHLTLSNRRKLSRPSTVD